MKHYVNFALLIAFGILAASALLRFFQPFSLLTTRVHIVFGAFVLVLVGAHLASRLSYFPRILRERKKDQSGLISQRLRLLLWPVTTCAYLLIACVLSWWPVPQLLSVGYEIKNRSIIFRPESSSVSHNSADVRWVVNLFNNHETVGSSEQ